MIVTVHRTYRSTLTHDVVSATTPERWQALLDQLTGLAVAVEPFTDGQGLDGITVTCATQRGPVGAFAVHSLACNYGALAVVE